MGLFYHPQKSGKGVAKREAEKRPFFKFWELFGRKFWKLLQLNVLYLLLCIPIVTIGPATAALTQVMRKFVVEQPIFVFEEFFSSFKRNFKQAFIVGLLDVVFILFFLVTLFDYSSRINADPDIMNYAMIAMTMVSGVIFLTLNLYIYPQIVSLQLSLPAMFKNAVILGVAGLKRNAVTVLCYIGVISVFVLTLPYSVAFLPLAPFSWLAFLSVFNAYPVIQQYIVNPYYEAKGEINPESPDYDGGVSVTGEDGEEVKKEEIKPLFTDLGGREAVVNKKNVKTGGKLIK
ncbi:MAG: DUF624 domain-containing protein [Oscillospiraceae bacterium]|nr:DUF624 domain-containing protein [Oscillospiraceae bacterium]